MKRQLLFCAAILPMLFLGACTDDETNTIMNDPPNVDGRVIGMVHGVVTDAANNAQLPGVVVTTAVNGRIVTTTTNSRGYYALTDLPSGEYVMTFDFPERAGKEVAAAYAVGRVYEEIPMLEDIGIVDEPSRQDFPYSLTRDVCLYPLTAGTEGNVFKRLDPEHTYPAGSVTVIADFAGYDISEDEYTTTTDAAGNYAFASLPATPDVIVRTLPFSDGQHDFGSGMIEVGLVAGASVTAGNVVVGIAGTTSIIVFNNFRSGNFGLTENLELTFSEPMQTETFEAQLSGPAGIVAAEKTWTSNLNLVIDPYASLLPGEEYTLSLRGRSQRLVEFPADTLTFGTVSGIEVHHTNLESTDGQLVDFPVGANIEVTYTTAVDLTHLGTNVSLLLSDLVGDPSVAISTSLAGDNRTVIIDPVHRLEPGTNYELRLHLHAAGDLGAADDSFVFRTAYDTTMPVQTTGFALDMGPVWTADWTTTAMTFRWDTQPGVTEYRIYARDTEAKSDFVRVQTVPAISVVSFQTGAVDLGIAPFNGIFDVYAGDGIQTPFTAGRDVIFQIAAYNDAGEGALSTEVTISDGTPPTGSLAAQQPTGVSANNTTDAPRTLTVAFTAVEYLAVGAVPVCTVREGGGNPAYVLPGSAITFAWNADAKGGVLTLVIPARTNASGDTLVLSGFTDSSGNVASEVSRVLN